MSSRASRSPPCSNARRSDRPARAIPAPGQRIGHGRRAGGGVGLDQLAEGVHPRPRGDRRRDACMEFGVHQRDGRQEMMAAEGGLEAMLRRGNDGVARGLRAGPGRRGDGDPRGRGTGDLPPRPHHLQVIQHRPAVGEQPGDGLGGVNGAAAAQADDHVASRVPRPRQRGLDVRHLRLAALGHIDHADPAGREPLGEFIRRPAAAGSRAVADHHRHPPEFLGQFADSRELPPPEDDPADAGEFEGLHGMSRPA